MRLRLERIMEQYGQTVTLIPNGGGEALQIKAFLQPVLKEQTEPPVAVTPLGAVSEQRWRYIGPAGTDILAGDRIRCGKMQLTVQEVRSIYWQNETLYRQAVLRREKEAAV